MMDDKEPYKATRLWNEVIFAFQSGMPLKRHRHRLQMYSSCFTGAEAVTWLHCYLMNNPNFGSGVTRQQTVRLLHKFLKCRVIENVVSDSKKREFADNSYLYRFTSVSPQQVKNLPLRLIQSPPVSSNLRTKQTEHCSVDYPPMQKENLPECHFIEKRLSLAEIGAIWKSAILSRLEKQSPDTSIKSILDEKSISGHVAKHNVCRISKTGVVYLIDKTDDIPHWVVSAMKCLANWPNASGSGSCLPNYPGFEKDVFKVVRDYFINPGVPLLPSFLSSALLTVFNNFFGEHSKNICESKNWISPGLSNISKLSEESSCEMQTSTPVTASNTMSLASETKNISPETGNGKMLLDDPDVMWDYPSAIFYETDFATSDPITRMIPDHHNSGIICNSYVRSLGSIESVSTISVCSSHQKSVDDCMLAVETPFKSWNSNLYLSTTFAEKQSPSFQCPTNKPNQKFPEYCPSLENVLSANKAEDFNTSNSSVKTITENKESIILNSIIIENDIVNCERSSPQKSYLPPAALQMKISSPLNNESKFCSNQKVTDNPNISKGKSYTQELKTSFQLILLFTPPSNRRQLHLLLRMINKILKNGQFILDIKTSMRDYLLEIFLSAIVQSDLNKKFLLEMASFLLDNCELLFQSPSGLKEEVEHLSKLRNGKIIYSLDDACYLTYCELVSKQQYEEHKISVSTEALKDLFESIKHDNLISEKERKKRLKQFQKNHPEIYHLHFPRKEHETKTKTTFLKKLSNLRM